MAELLWIVVLSFIFKPIQAGFVHCDETVTERQICKTNDIPDTFLARWPDFHISEKLMVITSKLTIDSIPEFNEDEGTITLNILLKLLWNDTRISLKPEYL